MSLTKKQRQIVWDKSGGICWYCGIDLPQKGWHAAHVEPVIRFSEYDSDSQVRQQKNLHENRDHIDNIVPACAPCNLFKGVFSLEGFRAELQQQAARAREYSVNFRNAERFGLVSVKSDQRVIFWFEQESPTTPRTLEN